jgi:catechol 2,3-dioxygenase-like lactoylglutathione lyase family enzyme
MPDMAAEPGVGVHSLDHFTLVVPDLAEARKFYTTFGLDVRETDNGLRLRTYGSDHIWADIVAGPRKRLSSFRLGVFERDLPVLAERLADVRVSDPDGGSSNGVWFSLPDGLAVEIAVAPKSSPDAKGSFRLQPRYNAERGAGPRSTVAQVRPRRLAHIAIFASDVPQTMEFLRDRLGLRLSDRSGDNVAFMHGPHGSDHHLIAIARSAGTGLHHCSWDVETISDVGLGAMQMADAGYDRGWGLGRHILGSNYFHYVRDPWGSYSEYSADMDFIPAGMDWPAGDYPDVDARYQWGPAAPADFGRNYELELQS